MFLVKKINVFRWLLIALSIFAYGVANESYLLTRDHPMYPILEGIFKDTLILENYQTFFNAGFNIVSERDTTMIVASHPLLKGYLLKLFLESTRKMDWQEIWTNFWNRCKGAENIRNVIIEENIRYFSVADKWIYLPSATSFPILVVKDMQVAPKAESIKAWKTKITHRHIRELFSIVSRGLASSKFPSNIPYTKKRRFAFIDTECLLRRPSYQRGREHLSEKMQLYWDELVESL